MTEAGGERGDLLDALRHHRGLFRTTVRHLDEAQAAAHPTVSELCLGGLVKHLAGVEREWCRFVREGPASDEAVDWESIDWADPPEQVRAFQAGFQMAGGETLAGLLASYDEAAEETDALVASADLDTRWPLPEAPWNEPGATWSARRVFLHLVGETAQHAGHADILRETIDGQKTMG